jgi:hypothetical protein
MIEIMEKQGKNIYPEDVYFSCYNSVMIHKPSLHDAMLFSIEEIFSEISFGCHKPWNNCNHILLYERYDEIKELYSYNDILPPVPYTEIMGAESVSVTPPPPPPPTPPKTLPPKTLPPKTLPPKTVPPKYPIKKSKIIHKKNNNPTNSVYNFISLSLNFQTKFMNK